MKIMYIASNPDESGELTLEREITELQRRFVNTAGDRVEFLTFPKLHIEELPMEVSRHRPDVLHISAHADDAQLTLANAAGDAVPLTGDVLRAYLDIERPPRLVYLNACNSHAIAEQLIALVPMAIGTTALISNRTARASALLFYDRILSGATVQNAFEAGRAAIQALQQLSASSKLYSRPDVSPKLERLHQLPQLVARFAENKFAPDRDDHFDVEVGVFGCPGNTSQVVFFTDDLSFVDEDEIEDSEDEYELASQLCRVARISPVRNIVWSQSSELTFGDYRICATGVTSSGEMFATSSMLCDAIEAYYRHAAHPGESGGVPDAARKAIAQLRSLDGSQPPSGDAPASKSKKTTLTRKSGRAAGAKSPERSAKSLGRKTR